MLNIGVIGCGAIGRDHIRRLTDIVPGCQVVACADYFEESANKVAAQYEGMKVYKTGEELIHAPEVQAVVITSSDPSHAGYVLEALKAGKFVFCEKPLAQNAGDCEKIIAAETAHGRRLLQVGFMRRYDHSYQVAKKKMENGDIGDVILVRCYSQDPISIIEGTLEYAPRSGGQFIDMSIHDFDLIRWLTGSEVKELWATGGCYEFKQYKDWDDGDNVSGLMKMENDAMAFFFAGRAAAHGSHVETEIVGTRGTLRIASVPTDSLVEVMSQHGVCRECYQDFITRWHDA